jgi:hypothetical protein
MSPEAILTAPLHDEPAYFLSLPAIARWLPPP